MKARKANVIDTCLHMAGFKSKSNPGTIAGLFDEFRNYETQEFGEHVSFTIDVQKRTLADLPVVFKSSIYQWNGSGGQTDEKTLYFVEFTDSTIEMVKPDYTSGSNYAYQETVREDGETINDCIRRVGSRSIKRVIHIIWDYSEWNELDRFRSVTIYK